ncbi:MAG: hypothetical protein ABSG41_03460 [Bryobacteraceae bacterium]|jgi:hypothetical protein
MKTTHAIRVAMKTVDRLLNANLPMMNIWLSSSAVSTHKETR